MHNFSKGIGRVQASTAGRLPRAIIAGTGLIDVRAENDPAKVVTALASEFEKFKAKHEQRYQSIEDHLNSEAVASAAAKLNGGGGGVAVDPEYTTAFANYTRRGATDAEASLKEANATGDRAAIQAAMSVGDNSSGGYIAPVEWDRKINKAQRALSPMRRISQVVTSGRASYSTLFTDDQYGSGWVGETANRPATATPTFSPLVFPAGEIYANPAVTQRMLDDSEIDLADWLGVNLADEFSRQDAIAFVRGDGINKPMGFLNHVTGGSAAATHPGGEIQLTPSGAAAAIQADALVDLKYALGAPYRQNAVWLMNSTTAALIAKLKDGQGNYLWREAFMVGQPATLLGSPVEIDENMPNPVANALPIAFGDFVRGYLINDRVGIRILRDPYTSKPYVAFYATKRVGGGVFDPKAIRVMKIAAN